MPRSRNRSTSHGSFQEHHYQGSKLNSSEDETYTTNMQAAEAMLTALLKMRDRTGKYFLHYPTNLCMAKALLERARSLDESSENSEVKLWQRRCLLQVDKESGYSPLHCAIARGNLSVILLLLRHTMDTQSTGRLSLSPISVLHGNSNSDLLQEMAYAVDKEGLTPLELLGRLQRSELALCREKILSSPKILETLQRRPRQDSFGENGQQELSFLSEHLDVLEPHGEEEEGECTYACEVVTFGRPHHSALGVVSSHGDQHAFRPQRVQEFAQDLIGRDGSAVAVAAATHHTLVATKNGHLYAFGLGKGGRLGMGEAVQQCPLPRRVLGPVARRKVTGIAAAENHSLCVTKDGTLFAWGSNRFGQLGSTEAKAAASPSSTGNNSVNQGNFRCLPRRVEDLKNIPCIAVAAGEKHSVALTLRGEVYVWGDNSAGQLGVPRRSGIQKVQRVDALWNSSPPKVAIAISAAEQSTLVLTKPIKGVTHVNSVYSWGHGNYVPIRVHFDTDFSNRSTHGHSLSSATNRVINPVEIACAKYHNTAITSGGHVFTWGLHAESLGRSNTNKQRNSGSGRSTSSPQLVTGLLPENGGGVAVALSASDQHTAVVTECGGLFTWGTSFGNNVLGHEGVKWQPSPKRVPNVHRAVNVAVAKEHTVVLIGSSFPKMPEPSADICSTLEVLAARKVAGHVDLFNVIPLLIMAERIECCFLVDYCNAFVRRNLDGVLTVGKKSEMNQYLNDMLAESLHRSGKQFRDDRHHPFIFDVLTAGNSRRPSFDREWLSSTDEWINGCTELSETSIVQEIVATLSVNFPEEEGWQSFSGRPRRASSSFSESLSFSGRPNSLSCASDQGSQISSADKREGTLDICIKKTANMDLSTSELAKEKSLWLAKEIRGARKKLNQIKKLQESKNLETSTLSTDEQAKANRQPVIEAELCVYETALEEVEKRIKELALEEVNQHEARKLAKIAEESINKKVVDCSDKVLAEKKFEESESSQDAEKHRDKPFACDVCGIKCPDQTSFELHRNGRKHRNRVAQAAEEEKTKAAASIMERHQLEQVMGAGRSAQTPPLSKTIKNAWGVSSNAQPKFTLPPPPHPAVPQVPTASLSSPWKTGRPSPLKPQSLLLSTPTKAPQAAGYTNVAKKDASRSKTATPRADGPSPGPPIWHSAPGSSRCVPLGVYSSPASTGTPTSSHEKDQRNSYSLADFLSPTPDPHSKSPAAKTWSSPQEKTPNSTKTFSEIQAEEADFKTRQDKGYEKGGGTWFLERRERADSLREIQISARKEEEYRGFIEEQKRIEEQIQEELALQRQLQNQKNQAKKKKRAPPKKKRNSSANNAKDSSNGNKGGNTASMNNNNHANAAPNTKEAKDVGPMTGKFENLTIDRSKKKPKYRRNYNKPKKKKPTETNN